MLSRRETRLFGLKFSLCTRSQLAWVPKGCREGAWGVTLLQGSGNNSQEALQEIFRAKVKGHCFSSQEASSLQACPSLHVCVGGGQCHRPREGVTPGRKMGRKLLGNSACSQEELGHQALALFFLNMAFLRSNLAGSEAALACVSLPASLVEGTFLRQAISQPGA